MVRILKSEAEGRDAALSARALNQDKPGEVGDTNSAEGFGALPYESDRSLVLRYAWFNWVKLKNIQVLPRGRLSVAAAPTKEGWSNTGRLERRFRNRDRYKRRDGHQLGWQIDHYVATNSFRYCPVCFAVGYHSYFFQLRWLQVCPMHNCPLVVVCQSCGAMNPLHMAHKGVAVRQRPYECGWCSMPVSGEPIRTHDMLDWQADTHNLVAAFEPIDRWCRRVSDELNFWSPIAFSDPIASERLNQMVMRHAVDAESPRFLASLREGKSVTAFSWRSRLKAPPYINALRNEAPEYRANPVPVWRVLARRLQRWAHAVASTMDSTPANRGADNPPCANAADLALACEMLRAAEARDFRYDDLDWLQLWLTKLVKQTPRVWKVYRGGTRLAIFAFGLVTIASYLACLMLEGNRMNWMHRGGVCAYGRNDNGKEVGRAIFYRIPLLDVRPFRINLSNPALHQIERGHTSRCVR
ncbi:MAG: hypothetical protein RXR20_04940 [Paraburkholderia sp.]|uniref:hypothetical protein n=1 Tax=Burkholderiaceae TaxID=119060 RepID=UPI0010F8129E|nr:hypothetical protein [Burkholderia sp. 4M9327F10]